MSIEAIAGMAGVQALGTDAIASLEAVQPSKLYEMLAQNLGELNTSIASGQGAVQELALGDMDNLHQLIMGMERTRLHFELLMSVRNRVLEAYQEVMRMQI
jgi:flagellar hook-basal body complex protein FliE